MNCVMRIIGLVSGDPSPHEGEYLIEYEPAAMVAGVGYVGGKTLTTRDITQARVFESPSALAECWQKQNGTRWYDGEPNRPLTCYTVECVPVER